jgi:hypothetical protein
LCRLIYEDGVPPVGTRYDSVLPQREIALRKEIIELHKKDRLGTINALLDILRHGKPEAALAAAVTALALEIAPDYAVPESNIGWDSLDDILPNKSTTRRNLLIREIENALQLPSKDHS